MTRSAPDTGIRTAGPAPCVTTRRETAPQRRPRFPDTPWGRLRGERGWSLRELGRRSGLNIADLSRIERGLQGATPDQARGILEAFAEATRHERELARRILSTEMFGHPGAHISTASIDAYLAALRAAPAVGE